MSTSIFEYNSSTAILQVVLELHTNCARKGKWCEYTTSPLCSLLFIQFINGDSSLAFRQNKALVPFSDDVDELNFRLKGANQRGRRLLGK
jgi:hypothetical protein